MEIKSKFNLNQKVFIIHKYGENKFVECDTCGGLGGITQNKKLFTCQDCYGHRGAV